MIRKFNYTGRKKIVRSRVAINLRRNGDSFFSFDAAINLDGLGLPGDAEVFVEAYHRTSYMRFDYGSVAETAPPERRILDQIEPRSLPFFRVKVVRDGRILAAVDKIIPRGLEDEPRDRICLLPVEFKDLGDLVWALDFSNDQPVLQLNADIEGVRETARSDPGFFSLVYPEILRQVLRHVLLREGYSDAECDEDDWQSNWLRFAQHLPEVGRPPAADYLTLMQDREDWIEGAVAAFCRKWRVRDRFVRSISQGER